MSERERRLEEFVKWVDAGVWEGTAELRSKARKALYGLPFVFRCEGDWIVKHDGQQVGKIIVNDDGMFCFLGQKVTSSLYDKFAELKADIPELVL